MSPIYVIPAVLAIVTPFAILGGANRLSRALRRRGIYLLALAALAGCGDPGGMAGGGDGGAAADSGATVARPLGDCTTVNGVIVCQCDAATACPQGAFTDCAPNETTVTCCAEGAAMVMACARPFGILSHECPANGLTCASGLCAISGGSVACCDTPGLAGPDPCDV